MDLSLGFSWKGLLITILPMIPNIFYFISPDSITSGGTENKHIILDIIEHGSQFIYIAILVWTVSNNRIPLRSWYGVGLIGFLLAYYLLWILLFLGKKNLIILICMSIFPVIYFILGEIMIYNFIAIIPTVIFGIVHVIITYIDYKIVGIS